MKYSLLHPSRSRPQKSFSATQDWLNTCQSSDVELIVSVDESDHCKDQYIALYANVKNAKVIVRPNRSAVDAINNAAKEASGEIFIVISDDTGCIRNWDARISEATAGRKDFVLKTYDGVQKWLCTMPILDRVYYNRFGYIYHPGYFHMFCDTEFTHVADITKRMICRNDIEIKHHHYSVLKEPRDPLYTRNDNSFKEGQRVYLQRFRNNFDLDNVDVWNIQGEAHLQWLKRVI